MNERTGTAPRTVVPVFVVQVGGVWLVDDQRPRAGVSETAVFTRSWELLGIFSTGS